MIRIATITGRILCVLYASACLAACGGIQNAINPAGPQAENLSQLWWLMFVTCSVVFVLVMLAVVAALAKSARAPAVTSPNINPPVEQERRRTITIIVATSVTVIILIVLFVASIRAGRSMTAELEHKKGVVIEIVGHQWWWEVRYLDVDASSIFTTANEIHIPVGVPVVFSLKANDVIHSFWVPNLSGKKDLIPGKINTIWLQADKPGVYRGQCAEYCGMQHAQMAFWVVAESPEQFTIWRENQIKSSITPTSDSQRRGQQIFLSSTCVMCHAINGTPAGSNFGPNLTHVASRNMIGAATLSNTREHLDHWIKDSQTVKPGNKMPQHDFAEADMQALLDYLQSLK